MGLLAALPLILFVVIFGSVIPFNLLAVVLSSVLLVVDVVLFDVSKATFQRDQILTKWK